MHRRQIEGNVGDRFSGFGIRDSGLGFGFWAFLVVGARCACPVAGWRNGTIIFAHRRASGTVVAQYKKGHAQRAPFMLRSKPRVWYTGCIRYYDDNHSTALRLCRAAQSAFYEQTPPEYGALQDLDQGYSGEAQSTVADTPAETGCCKGHEAQFTIM